MLPRKNRLSPAEIDLLKKNNSKKSSKYFTLLYCKSNDLDNKFAIIVSKKVSKKAVDRNRLKRLVREVLKNHLSQIDYNAIVIVKMGSNSIDKDLLIKDLEYLLNK